MPRDLPPAFPRIPLLVPHGAASDDRIAPNDLAQRILSEPVIVEEKLDGANVSIWLDAHGWPRVAARSGKTEGDRGGQLGRINAWLGERSERLQALLARDEVLYGEWLARTHTVAYDRLPDLLAVLDLWTAARGFTSVDDRDARCHDARLATPPILYRGVLGRLDALAGLHAPSRWGAEPAEGLVIRLEREGRLSDRVKWLAPGFVRKPDDAWRGDNRRNQVYAGE